jgi:hypothetical protein
LKPRFKGEVLGEYDVVSRTDRSAYGASGGILPPNRIEAEPGPPAPHGAVLFQDVRIFDGMSGSLSAPSNGAKGHNIERAARRCNTAAGSEFDL